MYVWVELQIFIIIKFSHHSVSTQCHNGTDLNGPDLNGTKSDISWCSIFYYVKVKHEQSNRITFSYHDNHYWLHFRHVNSPLSIWWVLIMVHCKMLVSLYSTELTKHLAGILTQLIGYQSNLKFASIDLYSTYCSGGDWVTSDWLNGATFD